MRTFGTLTRVELSLLLREPAVLFFTLALPLLLLSLNGSGGNLPQANFGGEGVTDVMVPGLILMVICTSALMALPETLANYRERGFLRRLRISPLSPWQILGSHAATHLVVALTGLILLMTAGWVAFDLNLPASVLPTVGAILLSAISVMGIGFLLAAFLPSVRTTQAVAAAIYFPAIFVSGVVMPTEALPAFAQRVGQVLPFTYAVRAVRSAWGNGVTDWAALAILTATAALSIGIGLRMFRWETRY